MKGELMGIVRSTCGICYAGCGVLIHTKDGKPVHIEGDPESPVNRGIVCEKAMASLEYLYHPERLRHPLKRTGNRGEGKRPDTTEGCPFQGNRSTSGGRGLCVVVPGEGCRGPLRVERIKYQHPY
jgi:NADH dehydrogenase/NADH:ubiquinone oxidoreductase subunit G